MEEDAKFEFSTEPFWSFLGVKRFYTKNRCCSGVDTPRTQPPRPPLPMTRVISTSLSGRICVCIWRCQPSPAPPPPPPAPCSLPSPRSSRPPSLHGSWHLGACRVPGEKIPYGQRGDQQPILGSTSSPLPNFETRMGIRSHHHLALS